MGGIDRPGAGQVAGNRGGGERHGDLQEVEAHSYSLAVHASQRLHGLFQAPLVAEGSCSLYRTDAVRAVHGWARDDLDGVMLTWRFLEQ